MTTVDELAIEMVNAKEQLKNINNTINKDRAVLKGIEDSIKEKNKEVEELNKIIEQKNDEIVSLDGTKKKAEEEF